MKHVVGIWGSCALLAMACAEGAKHNDHPEAGRLYDPDAGSGASMVILDGEVAESSFSAKTAISGEVPFYTFGNVYVGAMHTEIYISSEVTTCDDGMISGHTIFLDMFQNVSIKNGIASNEADIRLSKPGTYDIVSPSLLEKESFSGKDLAVALATKPNSMGRDGQFADHGTLTITSIDDDYVEGMFELRFGSSTDDSESYLSGSFVAPRCDTWLRSGNGP